MNYRPASQRAFTLLELLVVMTIMGIIVPILFQGLITAIMVKDLTNDHSVYVLNQRLLLDEICANIRSCRRVLPSLPDWVPPPPRPIAQTQPASGSQPMAQSRPAPASQPNLPGLALEMPNGSQIVYRLVPRYDRGEEEKDVYGLQRLVRRQPGEDPRHIPMTPRILLRKARWTHEPSGLVRTELWFEIRCLNSRVRPYAVMLARPRAEEARP
jgi:prepilin-type N-terminal cleavage/methylation domain-containing protein